MANKIIFLIIVFITFIQISWVQQQVNQTDTLHSVGNNVSTKMCYISNLPIVTKPFAPPCNSSNNYCEENNVPILPDGAYGPLGFGETYSAYPNDMNDYYYFVLHESAVINVLVDNYYSDGQLQLKYENLNLIDYDVDKPDGNMSISSKNLSPGIYLVRIVTTNYFNETTKYNLQVTATFPPPAPVIPNYPADFMKVYEDFEANTLSGWWSPDHDVFNYALSTEQTRNGHQSLKVEYNKDDTFQFLAMEIPSGKNDLRDISSVDLWVYGQEDILLKLEDGTGTQENGPTKIALESGDWTLLRFNLGNFTTLDLSDIQQFMFFPAPGDSTANGTIYFDEIVVRKNKFMLEDFEYFRYMKWWTDAEDADVFSYGETKDLACGNGHSFKIDYDKDDTYQFIAAEVPFGLRDWRNYHVVELWVLSDAQILLHLEDENGTGADVLPTQETNSLGWTFLRFNFSGVSGQLDMSKIKNIYFFIEPGDIIAEGVVYFDDISLSSIP